MDLDLIMSIQPRRLEPIAPQNALGTQWLNTEPRIYFARIAGKGASSIRIRND